MIEVSAFGWVPDLAAGLVRDTRVRWALEEVCRRDFTGGSASTPTLCANCTLVYLGDIIGSLLAIDAASVELRHLARSTGSPACSIVVRSQPRLRPPSSRAPPRRWWSRWSISTTSRA